MAKVEETDATPEGRPAEEVKSLAPEVVLQRAALAVVFAAQAMLDRDKRPEERWSYLRDCHGVLTAMRGPVHPLSFAKFRAGLHRDMAELLPPEVSAGVFAGHAPIDEYGDLNYELHDLLDEHGRAALKVADDGKSGTGRLPSWFNVQEELTENEVNRRLRQKKDEKFYVAQRANLILHPAGDASALRRKIHPSLHEFYQDIPTSHSHEGWWFPCPACGWPMAVSIKGSGKPAAVHCEDDEHALRGARYILRTGEQPVLTPVNPSPDLPKEQRVLRPELSVPMVRNSANCKRLVRKVWRNITIPGIPEIALDHELRARGISCVLWHGMDKIDLLITVQQKDQPGKSEFKVDLKDWRSEGSLAEKLKDGDSGGADWIVVPDHRSSQVPFLSARLRGAGLRVATATDFAVMVCQAAGVRWV